MIDVKFDGAITTENRILSNILLSHSLFNILSMKESQIGGAINKPFARNHFTLMNRTDDNERHFSSVFVCEPDTMRERDRTTHKKNTQRDSANSQKQKHFKGFGNHKHIRTQTHVKK